MVNKAIRVLIDSLVEAHTVLIAEARQESLHEAAGTVCWLCRTKNYPLHHLRGDSHYWIHADGAECGASKIHDLIVKVSS